MQGVKLALRFDPALLQFKAVRDSGLFGAQADLTHQVEGGHLWIQMQPAQDGATPVTADGQLLLIEFTTLSSGQAAIDFNLSETTLVLSDRRNVQLNAKGTQVQITSEVNASVK